MRAVLALGLVVLALPAFAAEPTMHFAQQGVMRGEWTVRNFIVASDGSDTFANGGLPRGALSLEEEDDGRVHGTLTIDGRVSELAGTVTYVQGGVTVRMSGDTVIGGTTYRETYFGYVLPTWANLDEQLDTLIGTVTRYNPADEFETGSARSFVAVHQF